MLQTKFLVFILMLLFTTLSSLYPQVNEYFENDFTLAWEQFPENRWKIEADSSLQGNYCLHHAYDNPEAGRDMISVFLPDLQVDSGMLSIGFIMKYGYKPSGSNNWAVYLFSDKNGHSMKPKSEISAYLLGVNFTGNDDTLKIWKSIKGEILPVFTTTINWDNDIEPGTPVQFLVTREPPGEWHLKVTNLNNNTLFSGSFRDTTLNISKYFGLYYAYTSTKDMLLWFDKLEIQATFIRDTIPPRLLTTDIVSRTQLELHFNESFLIDQERWHDHFTFPGIIKPYTMYLTSGNSLILAFSHPFPCNESIHFSLSGIEDISGNAMPEDKRSFLFECPLPHDVIISEIMADPEPCQGLPEYEYLELYNRTSKDISLKNWSVETGGFTKYFKDITLPANNYLIICHENHVQEFSNHGDTYGLFTNKSSLPDINGVIALKSFTGEFINRLAYHEEFHTNPREKKGGFSLELINVDAVCGHPGNWITTLDKKGGTPGKSNSCNVASFEIRVPLPVEARLIDSMNVIITFDGPVDSLEIHNHERYHISPGKSNPGKIRSVFPFTEVKLEFDRLFRGGKDYMLDIDPSPPDCSGISSTGRYSFTLALPEKADSFDLIISEILFNPLPGCVDFVEIYNRSDKYIDLSRIMIGSRDLYRGTLKKACLLTKKYRLIAPGEYAVLCPDPGILSFCSVSETMENWIEVAGLPSFPDNEGIVLLMDTDSLILDEMYYHEDMHYALISDPEGVSLEKICLDYSTPEPLHWHSASETSGFSTPGYKNSQERNCLENSSLKISLEPEVFSPDNDGFDDFVLIRAKNIYKGTTINIHVFDEWGRTVRHLVRNGLCGEEENWYWDGQDDKGNICTPGPYIIYSEMFDMHGRVEKVKSLCVLTTASAR